MNIFLLAFLPIAATLSLRLGREQSTAVKGVLLCNGKPAVNVKVKLYDDDRGLCLR